MAKVIRFISPDKTQRFQVKNLGWWLRRIGDTTSISVSTAEEWGAATVTVAGTTDGVQWVYSTPFASQEVLRTFLSKRKARLQDAKIKWFGISGGIGDLDKFPRPEYH